MNSREVSQPQPPLAQALIGHVQFFVAWPVMLIALYAFLFSWYKSIVAHFFNKHDIYLKNTNFSVTVPLSVLAAIIAIIGASICESHPWDAQKLFLVTLGVMTLQVSAAILLLRPLNCLRLLIVVHWAFVFVRQVNWLFVLAVLILTAFPVVGIVCAFLGTFSTPMAVLVVLGVVAGAALFLVRHSSVRES